MPHSCCSLSPPVARSTDISTVKLPKGRASFICAGQLLRTCTLCCHRFGLQGLSSLPKLPPWVLDPNSSCLVMRMQQFALFSLPLPFCPVSILKTTLWLDSCLQGLLSHGTAPCSLLCDDLRVPSTRRVKQMNHAEVQCCVSWNAKKSLEIFF